MSGLGSIRTADAIPNVAVRPKGRQLIRINLTHILQASLSAQVQHKLVCVGQISILASSENLLFSFVYF